MARSSAFPARITETPVASGARTVRGALLSSCVVSLAALFDQSTDAVSLRRILNALIKPRSHATFDEFHRSWVVPPDSELLRTRLRRLRQQINAEPVIGGLQRLTDLRHKDLAHFDVDLEFIQLPPTIRDVECVYLAAARVIKQCCFYALGRPLNANSIRRTAQLQARAFCEAIQPTPNRINL